MERIETGFVFAWACHKHFADIAPGALVNRFMNTDVVIGLVVVQRAVRREAYAFAP